MIVPYASRTGTRRNLAGLRLAGWRLLVSARGVLRTEGFPYALDNGAWTAFQAGGSFNVSAFEKAVGMLGAEADWVVVPDKVADGDVSLRMAEEWLPRLDHLRLLIAVQNGMSHRDVSPWLGPRCGIFLGGTTAWKIGTMRSWGELARERGCHYHVARVNSQRRISHAQHAGAHSFDGTRASRWAVGLAPLDRQVRQGAFAW